MLSVVLEGLWRARRELAATERRPRELITSPEAWDLLRREVGPPEIGVDRGQALLLGIPVRVDPSVPEGVVVIVPEGDPCRGATGPAEPSEHRVVGIDVGPSTVDQAPVVEVPLDRCWGDDCGAEVDPESAVGLCDGCRERFARVEAEVEEVTRG